MTSVQMDGAGRVGLPKALRDRFRLVGGDELNLAVRGEAIELRPIKARRRVKTVNGILVYSSGGPALESRDFVENEREERIAELMGRNAKQK